MLSIHAREYVYNLFKDFVELRTNGYNRDDAWQITLSSDPRITDAEKKGLLDLAKEWERNNGNKYVYRGVSEDTYPTRPPQLDKVIQKLPGPPPPTYRATTQGLTGALDPAAVRKAEQERIHQLLDLEDTPPEGSTQQLVLSQDLQEQHSPTYFGEEMRLLLYFKGVEAPLQQVLEGEQEILIGRMTANSAMSPDIDLDPYGGHEHGVSRMHAAMKRENNQLLITDLGSSNHTYINGKRLFPEEIRVLENGDHVWFGRLLCRIRFFAPPSA